MSGSVTQTVVFNEIPADWRVPGALIEARPDYNNAGAFAWPARALLVGQMVSGGTAPLNAPQRVYSTSQANALFGAGSVAAQMAIAFLAANSTTPLFVAAVAEPTGGTVSTLVFTFTGSPTAAGSMGFDIGGGRVQLSILVGDTPTTIAARMVAAVNANTGLSLTAANAAGVVTLTSKNTGASGSLMPWQLNSGATDATPAGLTLAASATFGTGDLDYTTLISAISSDWYTDIAIGAPSGASFTAMIAEITRRYTANGQLDAHGYFAAPTTQYSGAITIGQALNSPNMSGIWVPLSPTPGWAIGAVLCAVCAFQTANDPARQLRGLVLPGVRQPSAPSFRSIPSERDALLRAGISTNVVANDGSVVLERVITTYQKTSTGTADTAWLDIGVPKTVSRLRYDWRTYVSLTYPRSKLADDGGIAAESDPSIVTPRAMSGAWAARCKLYARQGWIENENTTIAASVFVRNASDRNRLDARLKVDIIGNLMLFAGALEFSQ